jgi:hypothetical protein
MATAAMYNSFFKIECFYIVESTNPFTTIKARGFEILVTSQSWRLKTVIPTFGRDD